MENLGPAPTRRPPDLRGLPAAPRRVLAAISNAPAGATLAELATALDLHVNTVRGHVERLAADGLLERETTVTHGRGRPAARYRVPDVDYSFATREYVGLVSVLAEHLRRSSPDPVADATRAGRGWGSRLVDEGALPPLTRSREVLAVLTDLGFSPHTPTPGGPSVEDAVRLRTCPLLDVASDYPDIVCAVHRGLVEGALRRLGAPEGHADAVELTPFAEVGACRLHLPGFGAPVDPPPVDTATAQQ